MEEWKIIEEFEGEYKVSNKGRVWSFKRNKFLEPTYNEDGYLQVHMSKNGMTAMRKISRLVATTFLPNPNNLPQVHHVNEIKDDNRVENLEWVSKAYNVAFSRAKFYEFIDPEGKKIKVLNLRKFAKENKLHRPNLLKVANGSRKSCSGYKPVHYKK